MFYNIVMNELYELLDKFKNKLDKEEAVKNIKNINKELVLHKDLLDKTKRYNNGELYLKEEILNDTFFTRYKEIETDINILILDIKSKINKSFIRNSSCGGSNENN